MGVNEYLFSEWVELGVLGGGAWYESGRLVRGDQRGRGGGGRGYSQITPSGVVPVFVQIFVTFGRILEEERPQTHIDTVHLSIVCVFSQTQHCFSPIHTIHIIVLYILQYVFVQCMCMQRMCVCTLIYIRS